MQVCLHFLNYVLHLKMKYNHFYVIGATIAKSTILQIRKICARKIEYLQGIKKPEGCKQTPSNWNLGTPFSEQNIDYQSKCELEELSY